MQFNSFVNKTMQWLFIAVLLFNAGLLVVHLVKSRRKGKITGKDYIKRIKWGPIVILAQLLIFVIFIFSIGYPLQMAMMEPTYRNSVNVAQSNWGTDKSFEAAEESLSRIDNNTVFSGYRYDTLLYADSGVVSRYGREAPGFKIDAFQLFDSEWNEIEQRFFWIYVGADKNPEPMRAEEAQRILREKPAVPKPSHMRKIPLARLFSWNDYTNETVEFPYPEVSFWQQIKEMFVRRYEFCQIFHLVKMDVEYTPYWSEAETIQETLYKFSTEKDAGDINILHIHPDDPYEAEIWPLTSEQFTVIDCETVASYYWAGKIKYSPLLLSFSEFRFGDFENPLNNQSSFIPDCLLFGAIFAVVSIALFFLTEIISFINRERQMLKRERDLLKQQHDLLISVAHELKTPMGTASLYAEKIGHSEVPEQVRQDTWALQREVNRMRDRLHSLLTYTRMENAPALNKSRFALKGLLDDVSDEYYPQMEEKGISFDLAAQQGVRVFADSMRISMAVSNFLSNAVKFTPPGGEIKLRLEAAANERARVSVYNSGTHVPEEDSGRIWSYLNTSGGAGSTKTGTGLGLPIVQRIIALHDGKCGVENTQDGVVFWFEIPVLREGKP